MDINVVTENLVELLTNTVNMTSVFYDLFINPEPMDVDLQQFNDENELITVTVPNRAKDKLFICISGEGSPEGTVSGALGTAYIDTLKDEIYLKIKDGGETTGWSLLLNAESATPILKDYLESNSYVTEETLAHYLEDNTFMTEDTTSAFVSGYLNNNGYITNQNLASMDSFGVVKIDGRTISMNADNQLVAIGGGGGGTVSGTATSIYDQKDIVRYLWVGTKEEFDSITTKNSTTFYIVTDA